MKAADLVYREYQAAGPFLATAQATLERHEAAHGRMLGIGLRLVEEPYAHGSQPFFATVESAAGLQVAALMTPPHKLQLYTEQDRDWSGLGLVADGLQRGGWPLPGVLASEAVAEAFAERWRRRTGAGHLTAMRLRLYQLRQVVHPRYPPGEFRPAALEEVALVQQWIGGFVQDCFGEEPDERILRATEERVRNGTLFLWVDGAPASMAARTRPTPHGEAVGSVYTPPDRRRKGYARAVVARLSQQILDEGRQFCTLYTDLSNPTSNRVYQQVGYTALADMVDIAIEALPATAGRSSGSEY
jgi:uncharacterized protein